MGSLANLIGIIHFGTSLDATHEAIDILSSEGHQINDLRVLAFPLNDQVDSFIEQHKIVFVVEQDCDAQLKRLLVNELEIAPTSVKSVLHYNGNPISAPKIVAEINAVLDLMYIGVSKYGDTAPIDMGQFAHVIRRILNMMYVLENNGRYGLTKGQDSVTADQGAQGLCHYRCRLTLRNR